MKKIFMAIALCFICALSFGTTYTFERVEFPVHVNLSNGDYIICYEASNKVKVFRSFDRNAISVNRLTDNTIICDDSLTWEIERIDNKNHFTVYSNDLYLSSENVYVDGEHNLLLLSTYGTVGIVNTGEIWSYVDSECGSGSYLTHFVYYETSNNMFVNKTRGSANPNTKLYKKTSITTDIQYPEYYKQNRKEIINGQLYIIHNNKKYNVYGF